MLMEQRILLHSSSLHRLCAACESLQALMFPFSWQHVYIPALPVSKLEFAQAPVPLLMGLETRYLANHYVVEALSYCAVVDLDNNRVVRPMRAEDDGSHTELVQAEFPHDLRDKVLQRLAGVVPQPHRRLAKPDDMAPVREESNAPPLTKQRVVQSCCL